MKRWSIQIGRLPVVVVEDAGWVHLCANANEFCRSAREVGELATRSGLPAALVLGLQFLLPQRPPAKEWEKTFGPVTLRLGPAEASVSFVMPHAKVEEVFLLPYAATELEEPASAAE